MRKVQQHTELQIRLGQRVYVQGQESVPLLLS
jgi:hypothetical protein